MSNHIEIKQTERTQVFEEILARSVWHKKEDKPLAIGIDGIIGSGKTEFARKLEEFLRSKNRKTQVISIDDFLNPKAIRYSGEEPESEKFFNKSFNIPFLIEQLLFPISKGANLDLSLNVLNVLTDTHETARHYTVDGDTIVIFEGVFLLRPEFAPFIDYQIFLDVPFEVAKERGIKRDFQKFGPIEGEEVARKYDIKYLPALARYIREFNPLEKADMIVSNANWQEPRII